MEEFEMTQTELILFLETLAERQLMRYNACMEQGASEKDAAMAFEL